MSKSIKKRPSFVWTKHTRSSSSVPAPGITPRRKKARNCFPSNPTHTGQMWIRCGDAPGFSRKYFCLKFKFLLSARSHKSRRLDLVIPLENTQQNRTSDRSFEIITKKKMYFLRCETSEDCERWVQLLRKAKTLELKDIYQTVRTLGISESNGTRVIEAKHHVTGQRVAIKIIDKTQCESKLLQTEIKVLKQIKHECVVQLYDIFETRSYLHLIMELCEGGELFSQLVSLGEGGHYDEVQCCKIIHQIARGVKYMHSNGIVHRDLKPENILCTDNTLEEVKIADFGISKGLRTKQTHMKTTCRTLSYLAPEVLKGWPYDRRVDHWSLGVIMYLLLSGKPPFDATGDSRLTKSILNDDISLDTKDWDHVSAPAKNLVKKLLSKDPNERGTLDDVLKLTWRESTDKESFQLARNNFKNHVAMGKLRRFSFDVNSEVKRGPLRIIRKQKLKLEHSRRKVRSPVGQTGSFVKIFENDDEVKLESKFNKSFIREINKKKSSIVYNKSSKQMTPRNLIKTQVFSDSGQSDGKSDGSWVATPKLVSGESRQLDDWISELNDEEKEKMSQNHIIKVVPSESILSLYSTSSANSEVKSEELFSSAGVLPSKKHKRSPRTPKMIRTLKVNMNSQSFSSYSLKPTKSGLSSSSDRSYSDPKSFFV